MEVPYTIRPIETWPGALTPANDRRRSLFSASKTETRDLLDRELYQLGAHTVLLLMAVTEGDIRRDGQLRASAKPAHPGVILSFESDHGPLQYAVDTFTAAWDNLRAIALGLEALRKVERYGITKRGQQYAGWKQLPSGAPAAPTMTLEEAASFLQELSWYRAEVILEHHGTYVTAAKLAAKRVHPDAGGSTEEFQRLQDAKLLLDQHHGGAR